MSMLVFPNAKINLGLNIIEKRPDGFHNIESCFYPVDWADALEITQAGEFSFQSSGIDIPGDQTDNLCIRAYQALAADFDIPPVKVHLLKSIPIGAGLGGGSSDAAFMIKALNQYFSLDIDLEKQLEYARRLGSDCAFFISNSPAYCFEKGDQFEPVRLDLSGKWIVLVNPGIHISTVEAYAGVKPVKSDRDLRESLQMPIDKWQTLIKNDFEATLFAKYPLLGDIKNRFYNFGAEYASMSGSGSTIFGIFDKEIDLNDPFKGSKVWQGKLK
jgi:4-diphosphocytidyl-2-C-methyl-D-erythritol kinase